MGAVVLTQKDATGEFRGVVLIQPVQQGHVQVTLPSKLAVHKWTQLQSKGQRAYDLFSKHTTKTGFRLFFQLIKAKLTLF